MLLDARSYPIQRVLEQYLEPKNLAYALRLWSTHYITQPNISLQRFVDDFYSRQQITTSSYGLYSDLLPAMMSALQARSQFKGEPIDGYEFPDYDLGGSAAMPHSSASQAIQSEVAASAAAAQQAPASAIPPAPEPVVQTATPETPDIPASPEEPPPPPKDEKFVIFSSFIRQLLNGVNPERREKMLYRNRIELKATCKGEASELLYSWLQTDGDYFQHESIGIKEMSAVTHVIYMGLCEYQGPVDADRILMKVAGSINDAYPFASLDINQLL